MQNVPDIEEAITRFNQGCATFERALEAIQVLDFQRYESLSRTALIEAVGALEWAVKYCLLHFCAERMTPEALEQADQDTFDKLLRKLARYAHPPFDRTRTHELHAARRWRNHLTHEGAVAPHHASRKGIRVVRRFLLDYLPILEEQLPPLPREPRGEEERGPDTTRTTHDSALQPPHRHEGGEAWVNRILHEGFERLRRGRAHNYDATIASLEAEVLGFLTRHSLALLQKSQEVSGPLDSLSEHLEEEVKELLLRSLKSGVSPEDTSRLHRLVPLINRYPALCIEAGWLRKEEQEVRFAEPHLPALLVGQYLVRRGAEAERLGLQVGRNRSWAEAAWIAVSTGDDLESWANQLVSERDPLLLLERVVVTCAAFGATPHGTAASENMTRAFQLCVSALIAFAPRHAPEREQHDPDSPWYLPRDVWRGCVLDLAQASRSLGRSLVLHFEREARPPSPSPLAELLSALGLPTRLSPEEAFAITALCAPFPAARQALLDEAFYASLFASSSTRVGAIVEEPFLETWVQRHCIPALRDEGDAKSLRALALPEGRHPAGYLLNRPGLIPEWHRSWVRITSVQPEEALRAWVKALLHLSGIGGSSEELRRLLLVDCLERLDALGLRSRALHELRETYLPARPKTDESGEQFQTNVAILRLLGLTGPEWMEHIEASMEHPALCWRTLLSAGAPQAPLARWCVRKHLERDQAPEAFRQGPVGVVPLSEGLQVLSSNQWQLSFQQAPEALEWFLTEGDASALSVLADACLGQSPEPPRFNPTRVKVIGISIPLSMVLWGKTLHRLAGREALYLRAERDAPLGDHQVIDEEVLPRDEFALWLRVVIELWRPRQDEWRQLSPAPIAPTASAELRRLLACFERRMGTRWLTEEEWLVVKEEFERQGWAAPTSFPWRQPLPGDPWAQSWPGLPGKTFLLACAAAHGLEVSGPLATLREQLPAAPTHMVAMTAQWLGYALLRLGEHHPAQADALLEQMLSEEMLLPMRQDQTAAFWTALIRRHGSSRVLSALDALEPGDCGLGLVDALLRMDIQALRERELRPELLRPILIRASECAYVPSTRFWEEAWKETRSAEEIPELPLMADGPWLEELLEKSQRWELGARRHLLGHLAGFSVDEQVRRQCVTALLSGT